MLKRGFHSLIHLLFLVLVAASATGFAQVGQARIVGTVLDTSSAVVPGAEVVVTNERTGAQRSVTTDSDGYYNVPALTPSVYSVTARVANFADSVASGVELVVGETRSLDFVLKVKGSAETVTVEATDTPLEVSSATMGVNVTQREVHQLPINGRQLSQLALQAPGAQNTGSGTFNDLRFSARSNEQNVIRYDGIEGSAIIDTAPGNLNGEIPSPFKLQASLENVQEFRVESNSYPAEYGTGTGGQIIVVSKSGSNAIHGSAFEDVRNDALDARNFFDRVGKSTLRLNQFGGSAGGPIKKDKIFFFGSYEGYRLRSGINFVEAAPSNAAAARAVPAVAPLIAGFRAPGAVVLPGASTNPDFDIVALQSSAQVNENAVGARFDFKLNDRNNLFLRYYRDQGFNDQPEGVTGRRAVIRDVPQNAVVAYQSNLSAATINEFKVGYNEALSRVNGFAPIVNGIDFSRLVLNITGSVANTGIAGQGASTGIAVPGGLLRQNSATNGSGAPYTPYSLSFIDSLSRVQGSHTIKTGGEFRLVRLYTDRQGGTTYTFSNLNSFLANQAQQVQFLGDVSAPSPFNGGATGQRLAKQEYYIGFAQDEWKVRPNLTFNYGLRYEYYTPLREARHLDVIFDVNQGILLPPDRSFFTSKKNNFQPRVSWAWSPNFGSSRFFGGGRTVLRLGFGIYAGPGQTEDQIQPIESDRVSSTITGGAFPVDPAVLTANFLSNPSDRQFQPRAYSPDYSIPERVYQYTFSVQQELPYKTALTVAYVGSQGRNLFLRNWTNRIVAVKTNSDPTKAATIVRQFDFVDSAGKLHKPYAEVDFKTSGGRDNYNALQASLVRRFSAGLTLNGQYTFGRSFGNSEGSNEALTSGNPFDYNYDRGYNLFDIRHNFNFSALYTLPLGRGRRYLASSGRAAQAILGNWEIGTIVNARSGVPIDVRVVRPDVAYVDAAGNVFSSPGLGRTAVINVLGGGASRNVRRPDLLSGVSPFLDSDRVFLNPAAFAIPAPGTFGNLQRGALHGPNFRQYDLMIAKRFPVNEKSNLEFRAEFFNLPNLTNFAAPPGTLPNALGTGKNQIQPGQPFTSAAASTFGILNSTVTRTVGLGTNRQIQFSLRVNF